MALEDKKNKAKILVGFRMPPKLHASAKEIAEAGEVTLSDVLVEAMERCLPGLRKEVGLSSQ